MNLPLDIQEKLKEISTNISINQLRDIFEMISSMYLSNTSNGEISLKSKKAVLAYSLSRMPATYSAFYQALIYSLDFINKQDIKSVISLGSGTGSDVLAISNLLYVNKIFSIEKEDEMISLMRYLLSEYQNIEYIKDDFTKLDISNYVADMVVASYSLNELNKEQLFSCLDNMINMANNYLLIVEPATKKDFERMKQIREYFISKGLYVVAPCLHNLNCPSSWCHFSTRINRSKIHRLVKEGSSPFEDEKFTYLCISKKIIENKSEQYRVLRHPLIHKGYIELEGCNSLGEIKQIKLSKKDKEKYKLAKKVNVGDLF